MPGRKLNNLVDRVASCWGPGGGFVRVAAAGLISLGAAAAFGQTGALGELRETFPGVQVYERDDRVRTVYGRAMTQGGTPREAADEWIFFHGEVFGSSLDLEEFRDVKLRYAPEGKERRVFMYRQEMDGLPVIDSSFRVMTLGEPDSGPARVVYVAGRVGIRPAGGLPEPLVTSADALAAAAAHPQGQEMLQWSDAELVALYDDAPAGDAVAYPAWRLAAMGETALELYTFYVHAVTGAVARHHSDNIHFSDEIEGTVSGNATPAEDPEELGPDTFDLTAPSGGDCPNDPDEFALPDLWVSAYEEATRQTLVDEGLTGAAGDYTLDVATSTDVYVFAYLKGPVWEVKDGLDTMSSTYPWGDEIAPMPHSGNPVTSPATGVNFQFNPSPAEHPTAHVNAHRMMSRTWRWLDLDENEVPSVPVVVNSALGVCNAGFVPPTAFGNPYTETGHLKFIRASEGDCANYAFSTVVAHEFGHFLTWHLLGVGAVGAFHEGFGDTLALLVFGAEIQGQDVKGCGNHSRWPRVNGGAEYPICSASECSITVFGEHCRGELLSTLWLDMRDEFGAAATRDLFLDWMLLAQVPGSASCPTGTFSQSADDGTLLEVLQAAVNVDPETICAVFRNRNIDHEECPDSAGRRRYRADCDRDGELTFFDFLCFQDLWTAGSPLADCDRDGNLTFFDFLCFQNEFIAAQR